MAASAQGRRGVVALFKRGMNEIPEVVGSSFMAVIGLGLGFYGVYNYYNKDMDNKRYKDTYVVMRSDDPRADKVHKD